MRPTLEKGVKESDTSRGTPVKIDFDQIRELLAVVGQTDITELTIESGDQRITVKKSLSAGPSTTMIEVPTAAQPAVARPVTASSVTAAPAAPPASAEEQSDNGLLAISSPMVGTFYRSPSPSAPSFVEVGDMVKVGQTVCIIEAMKLMNDLPAEVSGRIVKICVENGTTVEYGQPLFMVNPKG